MDNRYWNDVAERYEQEIFNVYANDHGGVLERLVCKAARKARSSGLDSLAMDMGCGIGNGAELLGRYFDAVAGCDMSSENISRCCERFDVDRSHAPTIREPGAARYSFWRHDLSRHLEMRPAASLLVCTSVLIMPSLVTRLKIIETLQRALVPGGYLLLVVPSLESYHLIDLKNLQWNLASGVSLAQAGRVGFAREPAVSPEDHRQGILPLSGVRTKHYLREELGWLAPGLNIIDVEQVCYSWRHVFSGLPARLSEPEPWDWALLLQKPASVRKR